MNSFFENLELLIFKNEIDQLVEKLIQFLNKGSFKQEKSEVLLLGNKHNRLNKDRQLGILSYEDYSLEQSQIVYALTKIIEELKEVSLKEESTKNSTVKGKEQLSTKSVLSARTKSQLKKIGYYAKLLSISKNICRIALENGNGYGTGVLVNNGWLLTNDFVLPPIHDLKNALAQFNYEDDEFGNLKQMHSYRFNTKNHIIKKEKGFAFVRMVDNENSPQINEFSSIQIAKEDINIGDLASIIQHPNAKSKEIDINVDIVAKEEGKTVYNAITFPGSSGSPVFNNKLELVGIHTGKIMKGGLKYFTPIKMIIEALSMEEYNRIFLKKSQPIKS